MQPYFESSKAGSGAVSSAHWGRLAKAHQSQGRSNDCGPYAAAMIINAITGHRLEGERLAREMDRPRWSGLWPTFRRLPHHATFPWGLADVLRQHGLAASWRALGDETDLFSAVADGRIAIPIIGQWRSRWAHYVVLVAIDADRGYGYVDPARSSGEVVWMDSTRFDTLWRAFGRTAVFVQPPDFPQT